MMAIRILHRGVPPLMLMQKLTSCPRLERTQRPNPTCSSIRNLAHDIPRWTVVPTHIAWRSLLTDTSSLCNNISLFRSLHRRISPSFVDVSILVSGWVLLGVVGGVVLLQGWMRRVGWSSRWCGVGSVINKGCRWRDDVYVGGLVLLWGGFWRLVFSWKQTKTLDTVLLCLWVTVWQQVPLRSKMWSKGGFGASASGILYYYVNEW